jgi:predicted DNA-binding ribbon-helix-helix protein
MPGKRVQIENETWQALEVLGRDRKVAFQKLADEALADLLRKHGRPTKLKAALQQSARGGAETKGPSKKGAPRNPR